MNRRPIGSKIARTLGTASLLALLPLAAARAAPVAAEGEFTAPTGPLVLTRTLRRQLPGGAEIVSTRSYEIRVVPEGEGYRVDGTLLNAEVSAPPALAALAELERQRPDSGLFPFRLDAAGMIASEAGPTNRTAGAAAAAAAKAAVAGSALPEAERRQAQAMIDQLAARHGPSGARWPSDLFRPALGQRSTIDRFEFGEGQVGSVTTTVEAHRDGAGNSIERTVVTESGESKRVTHETYTVAPSQG
jgi:hypothetical protein